MIEIIVAFIYFSMINLLASLPTCSHSNHQRIIVDSVSNCKSMGWPSVLCILFITLTSPVVLKLQYYSRLIREIRLEEGHGQAFL